MYQFVAFAEWRPECRSIWADPQPAYRSASPLAYGLRLLIRVASGRTRAQSPDEPDDAIDLFAIKREYRDWEASAPTALLSDIEIGRALGELFAGAGICVTELDSRPIVHGIALKSWPTSSPSPRTRRLYRVKGECCVSNG